MQNLGVLLVQGPVEAVLDGVVVVDSGALLDELQEFLGFEVHDLADRALLHEEAVGVVHVESDRLEELFDCAQGDSLVVQRVLALFVLDLSGDGQGALVPEKGQVSEPVVEVFEDDRHGSLGDPRLAIFVDQFLNLVYSG